MSLKNKFSGKTIITEGKTQGNYFSLIIFSYNIMFLMSKIIQFRKFVCALQELVVHSCILFKLFCLLVTLLFSFYKLRNVLKIIIY